MGAAKKVATNVTPIRGGQVTSDRKAEFIRNVASGYDAYVEAHGEEPDALVHVLCGLKQTARCGWMIQGASQGGSTTILAFAHAMLMREIVNP